ncbi:MAG: transcription termination/antitermination protein NusA [Actinomycetia bacterium]|nr:transcription termination/antitermination protein NusA [Actinomycetes bacterium]
MSNEMTEALQALAEDRGISIDKLFGIMANALESAYKRMPDSFEYSWVTIDPATFDIRVFAQELDEDGEPYGPELDVTPDSFGRIAAQTTKQILTQGIREVEREQKYEEYAGREGDIVTGIVQQTDSRYTLLDLGRVEALLPQAEQVSMGPRNENGNRIKAYIVEVRRTAKGPQIVVSRTHPGLIKRLFELEVPEIADGIVEIKACAREPGHRTKISVWSNDQNVDPVGACVGARGSRVRMVVNELNGEKVDIIPFNDDPYEFVAKALSPAKVKEVRIDFDTGTAEVIVPDFQLSLAIGKEGQNARLAHRLTGWRIDIKSETQLEEEARRVEEYGEEFADEEWAEGEWIVDPETGAQLWQPADGSPAMSAEEWNRSVAEGAEAEAEADGGVADGGVADAEAAEADGADDSGAEAAEVDGAVADVAEAAEVDGVDDSGAEAAEVDGVDDSGAEAAETDGAGDSGAEAAETDGAGDEAEVVVAEATEPGAPAEKPAADVVADSADDGVGNEEPAAE